MRKPKVGDKLKVISIKSHVTCYEAGDIIEKTNSRAGWQRIKDGQIQDWTNLANGDYNDCGKFEFVDEKESTLDKIIVHCPEKWMYEKLVELVGWTDRILGKYDNEIERISGGKKSVRMVDGQIHGVYDRCHYENCDDGQSYKDYEFLSYLGFITKYFPKLIKSKENKIMSVIKKVFKGKKQKALSHYDLIDSDGLSEIGHNEFIDYLWATDKEARDGFTDKIVDQYEEDTGK